MLNSIRVARHIRELKLADIPIQNDHRIDRLKAFLDSSTNSLQRLILQSNKLVSLDWLTQVTDNRNLQELEVIDQCLDKVVPVVELGDSEASHQST